MVICLALLETFDEEMKKKCYISNYGTLIEEIDFKESVWKKKYYAIFLVRRTFFIIILFALYDNPLWQSICLLSFCMLPVR